MATFADILNEVEVNNDFMKKATENIGEIDKVNQQITKLVAQNPDSIPTAQVAAIIGKAGQKTGSASSNLQSGLSKILGDVKQEEEKRKKEQEGAAAATQTGVGIQQALNQKPQDANKQAATVGSALDKLKQNLTKKK